MWVWLEHVFALIGLVTVLLYLLGWYILRGYKLFRKKSIVAGTCLLCPKCGLYKEVGVYHGCN